MSIIISIIATCHSDRDLKIELHKEHSDINKDIRHRGQGLLLSRAKIFDQGHGLKDSISAYWPRWCRQT